MNNIGQLLVQAQTAHNEADWSSLIQDLQQLILVNDSKHSETLNPEHLLELALKILEMGDFQQRWDITKVLTQLGTIAIPSLIAILEDEDADDELRWFAVRILGEYQHPDAIAPLVELLQTTEDEELQAIAATALGRMGNLAIPYLCELLKQEDTRLLAVRSLAYIRKPETITPLLSVVKDPQVPVRQAALEALSSFHDERLPPVLLNALEDVAASVRCVAVKGLGYRADLATQLDLVAKLQPRLYDFHIEVCCTTAVTLARIGGDVATQHLFTVLISPHTPITLQLEIIRALIWVETLLGLECLQTALNQLTSPTIWQEVVTVLGRVRKPELITKGTQILLEMLETQHPATKITAVKSAIALSLGQLGCQDATPLLTAMLEDEDEFVRLHAIAALTKLGIHSV
ncbi:HEAT repeat domain-containing protein [Nostoc sp. CMAA1605]|uniref:HEAT repeat domain-containing protein n=1 Tax=Nostoc sp. CMAA1605 TaxID=2055159 RepID=UPI001F180FB6|nr:HEAT repeat domain-containing protein [Nostoc sp. CMAA1605]MCF4966914.1 PBS lyase [Nostoc sp. CMAA1605]